MKPKNENPQQFEALVVLVEFVIVAICFLAVCHLNYLEAHP